MDFRKRFGRWLLVACMGALAACTSQGSDDGVSGTELNVVFPGGSLGDFQIGRVTVTAQCSGDAQQYPQNQDPSDPLGGVIPSQPDPDGDGLGGGTQFSTDLEFENSDAGQEIWHTFMDMLGLCQFLIEAYEPDGEKFCVGSGGATVPAGFTVPVNVVIRCDVSQEINTGNVDLTGTTVTGVGNFCPLFNSLEAIPDDIPLVANELYPIQDTTEFWACGLDSGDIGIGDIAAFFLSGGASGALASCGLGSAAPDPALDRCDGPDPRRVTYNCRADVLDTFGGTVVGPSSGTFSDPDDQDGDGDPTTYNGLCISGISAGALPPSIDSNGFFTCDTANEPGVAVRITCGGDDGDDDCYKEKSHDIQCPGVNQCEPLPAQCEDTDPDDCIKPDVCDPGTGDCPPVDDDDGKACTGNPGAGPGICEAGACVDAGLCDGPPPVVCDADPNDCVDGGTCDPADGSCPTEQDLPDDTACDTTASGPGVCSGGVCVGNCSGVDCSDGNQCTQDICDASTNPGTCSNPPEAAGTECDSGGGAGSGECDGAGSCDPVGLTTFDLGGEFRAYNSLLKPEGDPATCPNPPAVPSPTSVGGPVPPGPPVGTCTDPDLTTVPGSNTGAGAGIDTQCVSTQGIGGTLTFDETVSPIAMTANFTLDFAIDATVDLSSGACTTILNVLIATSSVNDVSGTGAGSVSDGGSFTLATAGDGFNVDYLAGGTVNCAGSPAAFAGTVCNLAGGLQVGDNPLPLPGDPGRRFWPVMTFADSDSDGKLEMQYATGPTTTAGWAMNNPPALNGDGTQFIATTGVQQ